MTDSVNLLIGDVVKQIEGLFNGWDTAYSQAIVVSSHPLVLASQDGEMIWKGWQQEDLEYVGGASLPHWKKAFERWEKEQRGNYDENQDLRDAIRLIVARKNQESWRDVSYCEVRAYVDQIRKIKEQDKMNDSNRDWGANSDEAIRLRNMVFGPDGQNPLEHPSVVPGATKSEVIQEAKETLRKIEGKTWNAQIWNEDNNMVISIDPIGFWQPMDLSDDDRELVRHVAQQLLKLSERSNAS